MKRAGGHPIAVYHDALALGHLSYQLAPKARLQPVELCDLPRRALHLGRPRPRARPPPLEPLRSQLFAGQSLKVPHAGDRIALAECLLGPLPAEALLIISFATSLEPSVVRPYRLLLLGTSDPP